MNYTVDELTAIATQVRRRILDLWKINHAPLSGAFSIVEIYIAFLVDFLDLPRRGAQAMDSVRFVPKGTSANALYAIYQLIGWLPTDAPLTIGRLPPLWNRRLGLADTSALKLGADLEQAIGIAVQAKRKRQNISIYSFLSDGALQCGVDHPAKLAAAYGLADLTAIVDANGLQSFYPVTIADPTLAKAQDGTFPRLRAIWEAYGWNYIEVDGHDFKDLRTVFNPPRATGPTIVIAKTVKGKGVPFMEGEVEFRHDLTKEQLRAAEQHLSESENKRVVVAPTPLASPRPRTPRCSSLCRPCCSLPPPRERLAESLKGWIEDIWRVSPQELMILNTDNPLPFDSTTPVYPDDPESQILLVGINERVALNIARGIANVGGLPIFISPAPHLQVCAEEFRHAGLDGQRLLMVGYAPGSDLIRWGPSHTTYCDCLLFDTLETHIFQPATSADLYAILDGLYKDPHKYLPAYLRLPKNSADVLGLPPPPELFHEETLEAGCYRAWAASENPMVVFITSGSTLLEVVPAASSLEAAGISSVVINALNLKKLQPESLSNVASKAKIVCTVMDADPRVLLRAAENAMSKESRNRLHALGIASCGRHFSKSTLCKSNGIDRDGLVRYVVTQLSPQLEMIR